MHDDVTPTPTSGKLVRSVGFWGLAAMVLNGLIGAAIFGFPANLAANSGGWAPIVVLLVGAAMLPVLLVMARLSSLFDGTGGPILYVEAAFGKTAAFQIGWMQVLSTTAAAAANVNLLADYALRGWGPVGESPAAHLVIVLLALGLIFVVNLNRTSGVARTLELLSVLKLLPLALLVVLALPMVITNGGALPSAEQWSPAKAALLCAYAFVGFEGALTIAGEARNPQRDMPRALVMVFIGVTLLYALIVWGYVTTTYMPGKIEKAPLAAMAAILIGSAGAAIILATATISIFANVLNNILFLSRRLLALEALDGLPAWLGRVNSTDAVPRNAVIFIMLVVTALSLSGGFAALAVLSVASRLIVYLGCIAALPVIERQGGHARSLPGNAVIGAAAITCILLIAGSELVSWLAMLAAAVIGGVIFMATRAHRHRAALSNG